jgi:ABC-2 type transport system permease protein
MPHWAQTLSSWLPFRWTFYFPIEALVGHMTTLQLLGGLGMQVVWIAVTGTIVFFMWRVSVRHYSAVGN